MATKPIPIKIDKEKLMSFIPLVLQVSMILIFLVFILFPQTKKFSRLSSEIKIKKNSLAIVQRGVQDVAKLQQDLAALEDRAAEYEKQLPILIETNMLIDSLKAITEESKLKFVSIEPMVSKKFELAESNDVYYELPVSIKLSCGFFETVDFVKKIETNKRLMKISELAIRSNPADTWNHQVEVVISNFARTQKLDAVKDKVPTAK